MGTGVGRTSYSILAQGHITQILSSKPEDRRMIFEEAAGITKFKAQKSESLRKLEYTEQNLLRVADLIREVKRQIGSLQRQAGKARRYKQISHGVAASGHATGAASVRRVAGGNFREAGRRRTIARPKSNTVPPTCCACENEITQLRERLIAAGARSRRAAAARTGIEGRSGPAREPDSVQRGTPARTGSAKRARRWRTSPRPRNAAAPRRRNWRRSRTNWPNPKPRWRSIAGRWKPSNRR